MTSKSLHVRWQTTSSGTWRYSIVVDDSPIVTSTRTFLTKEEARIESEWLLHLLGFNLLREKKETHAT